MERPGEHGGLGLGPRDSREGCWAGVSVYPCEPQGLCGWWVKVGRGSLAMAPNLTGFYPRTQLCVQGGRGGGRARLLRTPAPRGAEGQPDEHVTAAESHVCHAGCVTLPPTRDPAPHTQHPWWTLRRCLVSLPKSCRSRAWTGLGCMMEVGASPPDANVLIYPRPTPASPRPPTMLQDPGLMPEGLPDPF